MNALIFPLENIAKKLGITRRAMYDYKDSSGQKRPGRLKEMARLGICKRVMYGFPHREVWAAWEIDIEIYVNLKASKGEVLGRAKDYE